MNNTIQNISLSIGSGITPSRNNESYWNSNDIPWLKTEQIGEFNIFDTNEYISQKAKDDTNIKIWPPKTISIAMYGEGVTRGKVSILMKNMATNQACCNIIINEKMADHCYVYYWLKNKYEQLRNLSSGVRNNLNVDIIKEFPIYLPDISIQKNVAKHLSFLDKKIENNNKINVELEKLAKTLYNYWFVQFDFPNDKDKPYRASGGKMEYNNILKRDIPRDWRIERFIDIASITTGKEDANFSTQNGKYKFFTCGQGVLLCDKPAFSEQAILLAGNGDFNVKHYSGEFNAYQRTYVIIPKQPTYYSAMFIAASYKVSELKKGAYGSIVKFITMGDVENITLPVSDKYAHLFEKLNVIISEIELLKSENDELTKLRDFMLPLLMNGQVRVNSRNAINN